MAAKKRREEKAHKETKSQKKESLIERGSDLVGKVFKPLKAILDAYEARLRPKHTNEERYRAYVDPKIEAKHLEIFQKMIEGTHALLDKQLEKQRSFEDQVKSQLERGQVPSGSRNLVSSDGAIMEGPHKNKRRRRRANTHKKTESPPP